MPKFSLRLYGITVVTFLVGPLGIVEVFFKILILIVTGKLYH